MRVLALHNDVIVFVSRVWQTTCTAVRSGEEGFLIDSPVYPDELEALAGVLEQAAFPVSGLLATHGDWDHLLTRLAFPDEALGVAETTARRLADEPGTAQRALRRFDEEHYVEDRGALRLGAIQELPVPGKLALGAEHELELHSAQGHTPDGMSIWLPWARVLVCGDYLSPVEIPMVVAADPYEQTLARLGPLVERAEWVVPGHGAPVSGERARGIWEEDVTYLRGLRGGEARLPEGRRTSRQREIHAENVTRGTNLAV